MLERTITSMTNPKSEDYLEFKKRADNFDKFQIN